MRLDMHTDLELRLTVEWCLSNIRNACSFATGQAATERPQRCTLKVSGQNEPCYKGCHTVLQLTQA